jgi:hypothetical protein
MSNAAPAGQSQMPDITYKLVPVIPEGSPEDFKPTHSQITRTDKDSTTTVAIYEHETGAIVFETQELTKFRVPTLRFLNDEQVPYKLMTVKGEKRDKIKDDEPPCPKPNPKDRDEVVAYMRDGDKWAPIVEWFKRYRPREYAIRYGIIGEGEVQKLDGFDTNQKTGEKTPRYVTKQALIATRKIHLTEKPEANDQPADFNV